MRGAKYHVLSRIQDAGLDFTHRTNHLAQHLIFAPDELSRLPSPAVLFRHWSGWRASWGEDPRWLDQNDWANLYQLPRSVPLPARSWQRVTGDAGSAAALVEQPLAGGCFLLHELADDALLDLFAESLQLLDLEGKAPAQQWQFSFTTCYQAADNQAEFRWRACVSDSPALQKVQRGPGVSILPLQAIPAPAGRPGQYRPARSAATGDCPGRAVSFQRGATAAGFTAAAKRPSRASRSSSRPGNGPPLGCVRRGYRESKPGPVPLAPLLRLPPIHGAGDYHQPVNHSLVHRLCLAGLVGGFSAQAARKKDRFPTAASPALPARETGRSGEACQTAGSARSTQTRAPAAFARSARATATAN